jgi:hypothetical protein
MRRYHFRMSSYINSSLIFIDAKFIIRFSLTKLNYLYLTQNCLESSITKRKLSHNIQMFSFCIQSYKSLWLWQLTSFVNKWNVLAHATNSYDAFVVFLFGVITNLNLCSRSCYRWQIFIIDRTLYICIIITAMDTYEKNKGRRHSCWLMNI